MPSSVYDRLLGRVAVCAALLIAVAAVVLVLAGGGRSYTVNAEFTDAGQIVSGDLIEIGGLQVGRVSDVKLTPNGLADLVLNITDPSLIPLHRGTVATVALVGLAGEANRIITLAPGPRGNPMIPDGGVLAETSTRGAVDLDELLDTLTPRTRHDLQHLIAQGARVVSPPAADQFNQALRFLDPAFSQTAQLGGELVADRAGLQQLLHSTAALAGALAPRAGDITGTVSNTAATLTQVASRSAALSDALQRAPAVFGQLRGVLTDADFALGAIEPALRDLRPVAAPTASLLRALSPVASNALPAITAIRALLPQAQASLRAIVPVAREAVPALKSVATGIGPLLPAIEGLRPYMPDLIGGFFQGVTGNSGGGYDANGHYLRASPVVGQGGGLTSLLPSLGTVPVLSPRTGLNARCPGGASAPAFDLSNPWIPPGLSSICNPKDDEP
jgi:phospholipid/cholesterol/gamma-HCH transport system substrate-binding protein